MYESVVLESRAALMRNYADLPFSVGKDPQAAAAVVSRTAQALQEDPAFVLHLLRDMSAENRRALAESGRIGGEMLKSYENGAVLLSQEDGLYVSMGGEDQLCISARHSGLALNEAAQDCYRLEDRLSGRNTFAYDPQLGYLASSVMEAGTGLRACVRLHLPMLTLSRKLAEAPKEAMKAGVVLRGAYAPAAVPPGMLWDVTNLTALGRTEQEIIHMVTEAARVLCSREEELRQEALQGPQKLRTEDRVWRALGVMRSARLLKLEEFWRYWSELRLGAALELLPLTLQRVDALLPQAMPAHLCNYAEEALQGAALDERRAARMRELLVDEPEIYGDQE